MNTSYKIVLLVAFALFATVVGYAIFFNGQETAERPPNDQQTKHIADSDSALPLAPATKPPRPAALEQPPLPHVDIVEQTIGQTPSELPEAPTITTWPRNKEDSLAQPPQRPGPLALDAPETDSTAEAASLDQLTRPGPGIETKTPAEAEPTRDKPVEIKPETSPTRPATPTRTTIPRTYSVQAGDTFASIAEAIYGDERAWFDIAQANPSVDPKRLQVGQVIVLPNRDGTAPTPEEVRPPAPGKDQTYTVRPGDNLSGIAQQFYGDSAKWELIYARNRQSIGSRPNNLKVGMKLVIPQAYDGAE